MQYLDSIIAGLIVIVGIILLALRGQNDVIAGITGAAATWLFKAPVTQVAKAAWKKIKKGT
jgi:hypothetical protein